MRNQTDFVLGNYQTLKVRTDLASQTTSQTTTQIDVFRKCVDALEIGDKADMLALLT